MDPGEVRAVDHAGVSDLYYVETGMYDTQGYGCVYVLDAAEPAIVETGLGTNHELVLAALAEIGIDREELSAIVVTHIHLDHAGGMGFLAAACPTATLFVPDAGADLLIDPKRLVAGTKAAVGEQWRYYVEPEPLPEDRVTRVEDGDVIDLGDHELHAHAAPGHAFHQVVYDDPANEAMFTGDAAGLWVPDADEIRVTSPPADFDLEQCLADLETIAAIDPDVLLYTHFGPRAVGADLERVLSEYGRLLERWVEAVADKRTELGDDDAVVEYFAETADLEGAWNDRKLRDETALNVRGVLGSLDAN